MCEGRCDCATQCEIYCIPLVVSSDTVQCGADPTSTSSCACSAMMNVMV